MRRTSKKLVSALVAATMLFSMVGCGESESASTSTESAETTETASTEQTAETTTEVAETAAVEEKVIEKPESISWWTHDGLNEENGSEEWFAEFENLTGIHLDHQFIPNNE